METKRIIQSNIFDMLEITLEEILPKGFLDNLDQIIDIIEIQNNNTNKKGT